MAENVTQLICNLGGDALQIGGTGFIAIGTLYGVRGVSSSITDLLEKLPGYFNNPDAIVNEVEENNADSILKYVKDTGKRAGLIAGVLLFGIALKRGGRLMADPTTIAKIVSFTSH